MMRFSGLVFGFSSLSSTLVSLRFFVSAGCCLVGIVYERLLMDYIMRRRTACRRSAIGDGDGGLEF
jgi:hypothetical protein